MSIAILEQWLNIESISGNESNFLETLENHLSSLGYQCSRQPLSPTRWNLLALGKSDPTFLFSTHVDTVPPFLPVVVEEDCIKGRGACDTKGGIYSMIEAGEKLKSDGHDAFGYLFVVGEEVDHCGAKKAPSLDIHVSRIILCEPTLNKVVSAQKGMIKLILTAKGIAGHSAYPEKGESAVHKLLNFLAAVDDQTWPTHEELGPTTINVGVIEGGVAANVFAPGATAQVLIRTVSPTSPFVEKLQKMASDADVKVEIPASNDPVFFDPPPGFPTKVVAFNTDATYLRPMAPIWLVGPGDIEDAHSVNEFISFEQIEAGIDTYYRLGLVALK